MVGVIDWDFAQPGAALTDLAYLAWYAVPLRDDRHGRAYGFADGVDRAARLRALCAAYGDCSPCATLDAAVEWIETERAQTLELARRGASPWTRFAADGNPEAFTTDVEWIRRHRGLLLGA